MAGMCCGVVGETETAQLQVNPTARASRRRGLDVRQLKFVADVATFPADTCRKRRKLEPHECGKAVRSGESKGMEEGTGGSGRSQRLCENETLSISRGTLRIKDEDGSNYAKFGMTSVCGRRRDMEDAVAIHPSFSSADSESSSGSHFYGLYDGHGCSHVAMKCRDRLHEIVKEEVESFKEASSWKGTMERSFFRMDEEVHEWCSSATDSDCRFELQTPQCDAVGSTAVVSVVTPDKIVVSNCGDSRAVLCRNGVAIPLSDDHKPDREDELQRIEAAGGRVIYWDGPRVLGVLAMSRAIGDDYLKPYVIAEPEVTVTNREPEDECLILASDGLWDVVDNDTACGVVRMCLRAQGQAAPPSPPGGAARSSDKACLDASILLTKLALARHSTDNVSVIVVDLRRNL